MLIRPVGPTDRAALWHLIQPVIRAGETYPLPRDMSEAAALAYWLQADHEVFLAEEPDRPVGTYYLRANQKGGGAHVANCGYVTAGDREGRGVARAMAAHSFARADARGFLAMQFNFVVASNERAVRLWQKLGMEVVGCLPGAFAHPRHGLVDAFVMFRRLADLVGAGERDPIAATLAL